MKSPHFSGRPGNARLSPQMAAACSGNPGQELLRHIAPPPHYLYNPLATHPSTSQPLLIAMCRNR